MGTFIGTFGNNSIPPEKREEFTDRVLEILYQGGMMYREHIRIYGKQLCLLLPYSVGENGSLCVDFNYFENDAWESAVYDPETAALYTGKVGSCEFNAVLSAGNVLREFYTEERCMAEIDEKPFDATQYIGWLNFLFGESYTNERITDLYRIYELLPEDQKNTDLLKLLREEDAESVQLISIVNYLLTSNRLTVAALADLRPDERTAPQRKLSLPDIIKGYFRAVQSIYETPGKTAEETQARIIQLLTEGDALKDGCKYDRKVETGLTFLAPFLPGEIVVKGVAEVCGLDYESAMKKWGGRVIHYDKACWETPVPMKPLPPVGTADFLDGFHRFRNWDVKRVDGYRITDDDRAYYWREGGDVRFSDEMKVWMQELRDELWSIRETAAIMDAAAMQKLLVDTLADINETYGRLYCFADTFYEFFSMRVTEPEAQAAGLLLKRLADRNRAAIKAQTDGDLWPDLQRMDEPVRLEIKRYLAILGNPLLRKKVFGF